MIIDFNRYNGGGGSGSGVTPQEVQAQIDSALTYYWESGETKDYVDEAVSGISLEGYYTSGETDEAIAQAVAPFYTSAQTDEVIAQAVSGLATEQYVQDALSGVNLENYWTSAETKDYVDNAVADKLDSEDGRVISTALNELHEGLMEVSARTMPDMSLYTPTSGFSTINGSAITEGGNLVIQGGGDTQELQDQIDTLDEVVSAALVQLNDTKVGSTDIKNIVKLTQAAYDALVQGGTVDPYTFYIITLV